LNSHFYGGGYYPNGGASEIALNIIPVIEKAGGKVFVKANVTDILHNGERVTGVKVKVLYTSLNFIKMVTVINDLKVKKGEEVFEINAPIVVSNAGLYNTFQR